MVEALKPTWSPARSDVADWFYLLSGSAGSLQGDRQARAVWLSEVVAQMLASVARHARLENVEVTTASVGDEAFSSALDSANAVTRLQEFLRACHDFLALSVEASPECRYPGGGGSLLSRGIELRIDAQEDDKQQPIVDEAHPYNVILSVKTNLYVEATFDGNGDNRAWARANRGLLAGIFQDVESSGALRYTRCESPFRDQVRPGGFVNLATDYRGYHVPVADGFVHVVERQSDRADVVTVSQVGLIENRLLLEYELAHDQMDVSARILILEHLAAELVSRSQGGIEGLIFRNRATRVQSSVDWPPAESPPPLKRTLR